MGKKLVSGRVSNMLFPELASTKNNQNLCNHIPTGRPWKGDPFKGESNQQQIYVEMSKDFLPSKIVHEFGLPYHISKPGELYPKVY